jgi:hypothetical protein
VAVKVRRDPLTPPIHFADDGGIVAFIQIEQAGCPPPKQGQDSGDPD